MGIDLVTLEQALELALIAVVAWLVTDIRRMLSTSSRLDRKARK